MGGIFMAKMFKRLVICAVSMGILWCFGLLSDRQKLSTELIRFHVVAESDSPEDQALKLKVRDAVLMSIREDLAEISDIDTAKDYLADNIPKIQKIVAATLKENGCLEKAAVSFCRERFPVRHYDTFSLPAGVYDSLRIIIGEGKGKNWWCVTFPTLCMPATAAEFETAAVGAGFSQSLAKTLSGQGSYKIRFYFLDRLGELENIFWGD